MHLLSFRGSTAKAEELRDALHDAAAPRRRLALLRLPFFSAATVPLLHGDREPTNITRQKNDLLRRRRRIRAKNTSRHQHSAGETYKYTHVSWKNCTASHFHAIFGVKIRQMHGKYVRVTGRWVSCLLLQLCNFTLMSPVAPPLHSLNPFGLFLQKRTGVSPAEENVRPFSVTVC